MSTQRGRIEIRGFDPDAVTDREELMSPQSGGEQESKSRWQRAYRRFRSNRSAMLGLAIVAFMAVIAFFARPITIGGVPIQPFQLAPYDQNQILFLEFPGKGVGSDESPFQAGLLDHPFGTDQEGRDLFSRVLIGSRWSVSIGFVVVAFAASIGTIYGSIAAYYGGWLDEIMMRIVDVFFAFPALLLALVIVFQLGGGYLQLVAAFVIPGWATYARIIRGEVLKVKETEYATAAKALGARDRSVIFRHIVPNSIAPIIVQASLSVGTTVIGVAALGFLGVGFEAGTPEWGTMLNNVRQSLIQGPGATINWWQTLFPGAAIFLYVMAMNLIGDGLNDALDAQEGDTVVGGGG
ncbi:ABC transporter permease [Halovenus marina]|uniref:ABC transporter permease n=1 Tax=Halovenus marina TaxID=3396621 RepID=UPI003F56DDA9